ncbi:OmpP1/FadL family transporter [Azospirillum halopraeferens]|uniref:OmpP1/FadL family transporter n=1 Tax=Azospirillum halopraeferens TaxID=34010 RepID=UPI000400D958|nr:outer membrane protein transport protein [Azospirillum halopraeferens]
MTRFIGRLAMAAAVAGGVACAAGPAAATNGSFAHGYGTSAKAMAGAGVTMGDGPIASAQNPAIGHKVGNVAGLCLTLFMPYREVEFSDNGMMSPLPVGTVESRRNLFPILCGGANVAVDEDTTLGVAVFGNGGMNTDYGTNLYNAFGQGMIAATAPTGVDMAQAFVAFNVAHRLNDRFTVGVAPTFAVQRFKAYGLEPFTALSLSPGDVTDNGYSWSYGGGFKLGALWDPADWLTVGLSYQSRMWMTTFDGYRGLFAEGGDFDIPAWFSAGVAVRPVPELAVLLEWKRIFYGSVKSIANSGAPPFGPLGASDGAGFGWDDMDVFMVGLQWRAGDDLVLRAGASRSTVFAAGDQVLLNVLAPATVRTHLSAGFGYRLTPHWTVSGSYTYALPEERSGTTPGLMMGQSATLRMEQHELVLGLSYHW